MRQREIESEQRRSREEGERENPKQALPLPMQSPMRGSNRTNPEMVTWAEITSQRLNELSHPGARQLFLI